MLTRVGMLEFDTMERTSLARIVTVKFGRENIYSGQGQVDEHSIGVMLCMDIFYISDCNISKMLMCTSQ